MTSMPRTLALLILTTSFGLTACAKPAPPNPRLLIARSQIDAAGQSMLLSEVDTFGGGTMIVSGQGGGVVTWRTADFVTLSYRDGLLVATRGLSHDLMSADVSGTQAALAGGSQQDYPRFASYLGSNDETVFRAFRCTLRNAGPDPVRSFDILFPATLFEETCYSTDLKVENRYWLAPGGGVRRSIQWIGPQLGYLMSEQISREIAQ